MSGKQQATASCRLAFIDNARNISEDKDGNIVETNGVMMLMRCVDSFSISWSKKGSKDNLLSDCFVKSPMNVGDNWEGCGQFYVECTNFGFLKLDPVETNKRKISIQFLRMDKPEIRTFVIDNISDMTMFIEQLILNGIAVVAENYTLEFYRHCHRGVCTFLPVGVHMKLDGIPSFEALWEEAIGLNKAWINYMDEKKMIPKDPEFPIGSATTTINNHVIELIKKSMPEVALGKKRLLDDTGNIIDKEHLMENIYINGVLPEERAALMPYIFGIWDVNTSSEEIAEIEATQKKEFEKLYEQTKLIKDHQVENNAKIAAAFRVIDHDVRRTDRTTKAFQDINGIGLKMVTDLLKTYVLYNIPVGYLQGMNDLFVPILLAILPDWNDDGIPIDKDGNVIDYTTVMPKIFWCFDALLWRIDHFGMLCNVTETCRIIASEAISILEQISPMTVIWLKRENQHELIWVYSDLVLLFKRTFEDCWDIWCTLNCSPAPHKWLSYFVAAVVVIIFKDITCLGEVELTDLMNRFPDLVLKLSLPEVAMIAKYMYEHAPLPESTKQQAEVPAMETMKYFKPDWINE